jgi:hypothetical protein
MTVALLRAGNPEQRAVDYLAAEVPRWSRENGCFSCHNNGDGARALYAAVQRGYRLPDAALRETTQWLLAPREWDEKVGNAEFKDRKLARIQFAAALLAASNAGVVKDSGKLLEAAEAVAGVQDADGSWQVDAAAAAGSPATYGAALSTYMASRVLKQAAAKRFEKAIARADDWFRTFKPRSVPDAAAVLLAKDQPGEALELIRRAQSSDGGWGPQPQSPSEPYDTALVLLALQRANEHKAVERGRAFLISIQLPTGGWQETTRPAGARSYAQHISTSAWATLALLATDAKRQ